MSSEGFNNAGTTASQSGTGDVAWSPATLTANAQLDANQKTQELRCTNLGFSAPGDAETITGVEVEFTRADLDSSNFIFDDKIQLLVAGFPAGLPVANSSVPWAGSTAVTYGSSSSNWGVSSLTGAQVKASNFGVLLKVENRSGGPADVDIAVSAVKVKIHWGSGGGGLTVDISGPAIVGRGDKVVLTATEIAGATYSWSSSPGLLNATASGRTYTIDRALQPGKYAITVSVNGGAATDTFILTVVKVEIVGHDTTPDNLEIYFLSCEAGSSGSRQAMIPLLADIYPQIPGGKVSWSLVAAPNGTAAISDRAATATSLIATRAATSVGVTLDYLAPNGVVLRAKRVVSTNSGKEVIDDDAYFAIVDARIAFETYDCARSQFQSPADPIALRGDSFRGLQGAVRPVDIDLGIQAGECLRISANIFPAALASRIGHLLTLATVRTSRERTWNVGRIDSPGNLLATLLLSCVQPSGEVHTAQCNAVLKVTDVSITGPNELAVVCKGKVVETRAIVMPNRDAEGWKYFWFVETADDGILVTNENGTWVPLAGASTASFRVIYVQVRGNPRITLRYGPDVGRALPAVRSVRGTLEPDLEEYAALELEILHKIIRNEIDQATGQPVVSENQLRTILCCDCERVVFTPVLWIHGDGQAAPVPSAAVYSLTWTIKSVGGGIVRSKTIPTPIVQKALASTNPTDRQALAFADTAGLSPGHYVVELAVQLLTPPFALPVPPTTFCKAALRFTLASVTLSIPAHLEGKVGGHVDPIDGFSEYKTQFVTPVVCADKVRVVAHVDPKDVDFDDNFTWHNATETEAGEGEEDAASVAIPKWSKEKLKAKEGEFLVVEVRPKGEDVACAHIALWSVWCKIEGTKHDGPILREGLGFLPGKVYEKNRDGEYEATEQLIYVSVLWSFVATITPPEIVGDRLIIPALQFKWSEAESRGAADVPCGGSLNQLEHEKSTAFLRRGVTHLWDMSRMFRVAFKVVSKTLDEGDFASWGAMARILDPPWPGQWPQRAFSGKEELLAQFPPDMKAEEFAAFCPKFEGGDGDKSCSAGRSVIGTDDLTDFAQDNNPYRERPFASAAALSEFLKGFTLTLKAAQLGSYDAPSQPGVSKLVGDEGDTIEVKMDFREFVRLLIGFRAADVKAAGTWFRVSDSFEWFFYARLVKKDGEWKDNGSESGSK